MGREAIHSDSLSIEQSPDIIDPAQYDGDVVVGDRIIKSEYAAELAFNEEPVTIRLESSAEQHAPTHFPVWINGKMAEVFQNGRWEEIGYLPIGMIITVKRKAVEVIVRAKKDTVRTEIRNPEADNPNNVIQRYTSAAASFSIIEDRNPRGIAWMTELRRRNM